MASGICRLTNLGNTCYMNSVFQILTHTPELTHILVNAKPSATSIRSEAYDLVYLWKQLMMTVYGSPSVQTISPRSLVNCIRKLSVKRAKSGYDTTNQQDASDFIVFVMETFHTAISYKANLKSSRHITEPIGIEYYARLNNLYASNYSDIIKTFYGMIITEMIDPQTANVLTRTFDPYFIVNASVPTEMESISLYDCLDTVFGEEVLDESNRWINPETKELQDVIKKTSIWNIPYILVVNLKKYTATSKLHHPINIPHTLDMSEYIHSLVETNSEYVLYAVCNHTGSLTSGHYYSYVFVAHLNSWICLNDAEIPRKISTDAVITPDAVCLFYRRTSP
jgi:ubiquitin C-terminal hydrolase